MSVIPLGFWKSKGTQYEYLDPADYPTYGWSFWKRNPDYTGACIRVRRSSDNTEQDIGFGSDNYLDVSAMQSFVGAGTGWLVTWYAQFGSINLTNIFSGNTGYMPRLIISGTLQTFSNGVACIPFGNGTSEGYTNLGGGSGTNMMTRYTSTIFWSEENTASVANQLAGYTNNNGLFALRESVSGNATRVYFDVGVTENYFINTSKELEGYNNFTSCYPPDLYQAANYRASIEGHKLFAMRGVGYNTLGTGFVLGGRWDNSTTYSRIKMNECLIYNNQTLSEAKLKEVQNVLNASQNCYDLNDVTDNLVLWYDAGNTSSYPGSGTAITDLSVAGANGTLQNGTAYSSADGGKFVLDGINDWISTTGTTVYPWFVGGGDYSIEVWVKFSNANHSARIMGNRNSGTGVMMSSIAGTIDVNGNITASKKLSFAITNVGTSRAQWMYTTNDVIDGNWKHCVFTRTARDLKVYVNGVSQSMTAVNTVGSPSHIYINSGQTWRVADAGGGTGGQGAFDISIIRLYKCELNQSQVTRNFNLEKSRYGL